MSNVKLGNQTISGVESVNLEDADNEGSYIKFINESEVPNVVQTTGQSETDVMSQKSVTDALSDVGGKKLYRHNIDIKDNNRNMRISLVIITNDPTPIKTSKEIIAFLYDNGYISENKIYASNGIVSCTSFGGIYAVITGLYWYNDSNIGYVGVDFKNNNLYVGYTNTMPVNADSVTEI